MTGTGQGRLVKDGSEVTLAVGNGYAVNAESVRGAGVAGVNADNDQRHQRELFKNCKAACLLGCEPLLCRNWRLQRFSTISAVLDDSSCS